MRIAQIDLKDWGCFRGEHRLVLEPKMYALVAQLDGQPARSNGLGKSFLIESIAFALFERYRFRTADEIITKGEKTTEVRLTFDDGSVVIRSRRLGQSTRLWYRVDGREFYGPEAQDEIVRRIGLDEQDFHATCSFEQRQMARFVLARPEERMDIVSGWLGLEPLERAEADVRGRASELWKQSNDLASNIESRKLMERESVGDYQQIAGGLEGKVKVLQERLALAKQASSEARISRLAAEAVTKHFEAADYFDRLVVEGKGLAENTKALECQVKELSSAGVIVAYQQALSELAAAKREVDQRRLVAQGKFDGRCPVIEMACPAKDEINQAREIAQTALTKAMFAQANREKVAQTTGVEMTKLTQLQLKHREVATKLQSARTTALELKPSKKKVEGQLRPELRIFLQAEEEAAANVSEIERELAGFEHRLLSAERARKEQKSLLQKQAELDKRIAVVQEAVKIFGKNGAQRRVAEAALDQVEALANVMLAEAGISLSVEVRWSREGKGLASACYVCGWPFPASARVKACGRCKEQRGPKLVHALDLVLSWRSGAAEDLGGSAIQLAASAWLRAARGSRWSTALIDEPTSQLDAAHRASWLSGAARMLSSAGFEQAIIISHSPQVQYALPGRIEIVSDGQFSRVRVVCG